MRKLAAIVLAVVSAGTALFAEVPRPAGGLQWKTPDGQTRDLSKYKGKNVCLEILSTGCPHCQQTAAMLSRIMADFPAKDLQIIGVAINDDANIPDFIRQNNVKFPVGKGNRDQAFAFLQQSVMRPFYFPGLVFVDPQGNIQAQYIGTDAFVQNGQEANLRAQFKKMLSASPRPSTNTKTRSRKAS